MYLELSLSFIHDMWGLKCVCNVNILISAHALESASIWMLAVGTCLSFFFPPSYRALTRVPPSMLAYVYLYLHVKRCRAVNYSCAAVRLSIDWALNTRHSDDDLWGFSLQWQKSKEVHISGFQSVYFHRFTQKLRLSWKCMDAPSECVCAHVGFVPEYLLRPFYHA